MLGYVRKHDAAGVAYPQPATVKLEAKDRVLRDLGAVYKAAFAHAGDSKALTDLYQALEPILKAHKVNIEKLIGEA